MLFSTICRRGFPTTTRPSRNLPFLLAAISLHSNLISTFSAFLPSQMITKCTTTIPYRDISTTATTPFLLRPTKSIPQHQFKQFASASDGDGGEDDDQSSKLTHIYKMELQEILFHVENGTGDKKYVVIDVRGEDEVYATGKIHPMVHTLPLPYIAMRDGFNLDEEDFEDAFGFPKPNLSDTLVFTCKAGIRSQQAAQIAAYRGYNNLVNYIGGADDWFN